jgi:hypothetical protein
MNCQLWSVRCSVHCPQRNSFILDNKISAEDIRLRQGYGGRVRLYGG